MLGRDPGRSTAVQCGEHHKGVLHAPVGRDISAVLGPLSTLLSYSSYPCFWFLFPFLFFSFFLSLSF